MIFLKDLNIMKESLAKEGCKNFINHLTWFSDSLYGSYEAIWSGFCSKLSEGGEYEEEDSRKLNKAKMIFEYTLMDEIKTCKYENINIAVSQYPIVFKDLYFILNKNPRMN